MFGVFFDQGTELSKEMQILLASPVQFFIGSRFYRNGWRALKNGAPNMDVLVAVGTSAAYFLSVYLEFFFQGYMNHHLYFESSSVMITRGHRHSQRTRFRNDPPHGYSPCGRRHWDGHGFFFGECYHELLVTEPRSAARPHSLFSG